MQRHCRRDPLMQRHCRATKQQFKCLTVSLSKFISVDLLRTFFLQHRYNVDNVRTNPNILLNQLTILASTSATTNCNPWSQRIASLTSTDYLSLQRDANLINFPILLRTSNTDPTHVYFHPSAPVSQRNTASGRRATHFHMVH